MAGSSKEMPKESPEAGRHRGPPRKKTSKLDDYKLDSWLDTYIKNNPEHLLFVLGHYEHLTREQACNAQDLVVLFPLIKAYLELDSKGLASRTPIQEAMKRALGRNKDKACNKSKYDNGIFAKFFGKKFLVVMFHLRRLKRIDEELACAMNALDDASAAKLEALVELHVPAESPGPKVA